MAVRREANVVGRLDRVDPLRLQQRQGAYSAHEVHGCVTLPCLGGAFPVRLRESRDDKKCIFIKSSDNLHEIFK
jgi:hypothetical protein